MRDEIAASMSEEPRQEGRWTARTRRLVSALLAELGDARWVEVLEIGPVDRRVTSALSTAHPGFHLSKAEPGRPLAFPDAAFDLVVTSASFHRLGEWQEALEEISRVLRPGGHLLWTELEVEPELRTLLRLWRHRHGLYTPEEVRAALSHEMRAGGLYRRVGGGRSRRSPLILVKEPRAAA